MELDNGKKYAFQYDHLSYWNENQKIVELKTEHQYQNTRILDVIIDSEFGGIFFKMENDMILYHNNIFGSELVFEKYSEVFDSNGELI